MGRSKLIDAHAGKFWTRAEIHAALDEYLDEQESIGRQGERFLSINFDDRSRVTSLKRCDQPPAFKAFRRRA